MLSYWLLSDSAYLLFQSNYHIYLTWLRSITSFLVTIVRDKRVTLFKLILINSLILLNKVCVDRFTDYVDATIHVWVSFIAD